MEVKLRNDAHPDNDKNQKTPEGDITDLKTNALVACGGDFSIYVDDGGRIYATGSTHLQVMFMFSISD